MIWSLRTSWEYALQAARVRDLALRERSFAPDAFDISALPIKKLKASGLSRDLSQLGRVVAHVTAVVGGFGVSRRRVAHWGSPGVEIPSAIERQLADLDLDSVARRLALWERYRDTPYQEIGARNGDVIRNRPLSQRSYHAGRGNDGVGWALDCGPDETLDSFTIETGRASLADLLRRTLAASSVRPILVAPHRAFTRQRVRDTSATVWREVVKPTVKAFDGEALIDYKIKRGSGRPVPRSWDPAALFDDQGRPL